MISPIRVLARATCCAPVVVCVATSSFAGAEEWVPQRPLRLIVPFAPGGTADLLARLLATPMGNALGQQIVVDNRGGAGGVISMDAVAHAQPDGYVFGIPSLSAPAYFRLVRHRRHQSYRRRIAEARHESRPRACAVQRRRAGDGRFDGRANRHDVQSRVVGTAVHQRRQAARDRDCGPTALHAAAERRDDGGSRIREFRFSRIVGAGRTRRHACGCRAPLARRNKKNTATSFSAQGSKRIRNRKRERLFTTAKSAHGKTTTS